MIQAVIKRMADNSFLLKGWGLTLVAALAALSAADRRAEFAWLALFPALVFWGLDAYYLREERLLRELYNRVRKASTADLERDPFSMDTSPHAGGVKRWLTTCGSRTIVSFYGAIVALIFVVGILASV